MKRRNKNVENFKQTQKKKPYVLLIRENQRGLNPPTDNSSGKIKKKMVSQSNREPKYKELCKVVLPPNIFTKLMIQ